MADDMVNRKDILDEYCEALARLLTVSLADMNPEQARLVAAAIEGGTATIQVVTNLAPLVILGALRPTDRGQSPIPLFRIDASAQDVTRH